MYELKEIMVQTLKWKIPEKALQKTPMANTLVSKVPWDFGYKF